MMVALPARVLAGAAFAILATAAPAFAGSLSDMLNQRISEAQQAESNNLFEIALRDYAQALQLSVDSPGARRMLLKKRAALYEQLNMLPLAEADLTALAKVEPLDPTVFADRGYFYLRHGRYSEALDDFIAGSRVAPKNPAFFYGAARVLVAKRDDTNAVNFYNEAIESAPGDAKLYLARAEALLRLHKFAEALADYDRAVKLGLAAREDRFFAAVGRGYVNVMLGNFGLAVEAFNAALAIHPESPNVVLWRGFSYERQGARDLALQDYEKAAATLPDLSEARDGVVRLRSQRVSAITGASRPQE